MFFFTLRANRWPIVAARRQRASGAALGVAAHKRAGEAQIADAAGPHDAPKAPLAHLNAPAADGVGAARHQARGGRGGSGLDVRHAIRRPQSAAVDSMDKAKGKEEPAKAPFPFAPVWVAQKHAAEKWPGCTFTIAPHDIRDGRHPRIVWQVWHNGKNVEKRMGMTLIARTGRRYHVVEDEPLGPDDLYP